MKSNAVCRFLVTAAISVAGAVLGSEASATGSHNVHGYMNKHGTYVMPHRQTNPDHSKLNNWSTKGKVNPYTGKPGTKNPHGLHPPH